MQLQHQVTQKWRQAYFLHESDPRRDRRCQIVSVFILSPHALALHLAVKILLQIFLWWFWARWPYIHLSAVFPPECARSALCAATNTIKWKTFLIFDINHQQNTRRSDQIETIKTIMQTTRPRITWKVLPMAQVAILKKHSIKLCYLDRELFTSWTKTSQRLTLYLLSSHR